MSYSARKCIWSITFSFMHKQYKTCLKFNIRLFTDHTLLYLSFKVVYTLQSNINNEIGKVELWLQENKLSINVSKTKYMTTSLNFKSNYNFKIELLGTAHQQLNFQKYFRVIIDDKLSWYEHITTVIAKLSNLCGLFYKLRNYVDRATLKKAYFALAQPVMHYGLICWGSCAKSIAILIKILINIILRCTNFVRLRQMHVTELYSLSNNLNLQDAYKTEVCKFMYSSKQNNLPNTFSNYIFEIQGMHTYDTKQVCSNNYFLSRKCKVMSQKTLYYQGVKLRNKLPALIKSASSLNAEAKFLKRFFIAVH